MPTIDKVDGFRVFFYSNEEGEPPHVHLKKGGCRMKVWLEPVSVASSIKCKAKESKAGETLVRAKRGTYLEEWIRYEQRKSR